MKKKAKLISIKLDKLRLDVDNPRFAELYSGSDNEDELIEYLLYNESAEDLAKGIIQAGEFYQDRPLWVLKTGNHYLVKDGNRRCAAIKALRIPTKFELSLPKQTFTELPALLYTNEADLQTRILQEHTNSLFREWDRIAKALEAYKLFNGGNSLETMKEIDSQPAQLIKLASFYYRAVKVGGEEMKKLLRRGRGKTGGKTIIFERLFKFCKICGYTFRNSPSYELNILDEERFDLYISSMIQYLKKYPETKTQDIDEAGESFLNKLIPFGFSFQNNSANDSSGNTTKENNSDGDNNSENTQSSQETNQNQKGRKKKSIKHRPSYERKKIPAPLDRLIDECYNLDQNNFPNAKTALTRVSFECALKFIVENTIYKNRKNICDSNYFRNVFFDNNGAKKIYTDFTKLKSLFAQLIKNTGDRKAFENFDLERTHQIIHNYKVGAIPADAKGLCDNLIALLEFMLKEEPELLNNLDLAKL